MPLFCFSRLLGLVFVGLLQAEAFTADASVRLSVDQCLDSELQAGITEWHRRGSPPDVTVEWGYGNVSRSASFNVFCQRGEV